MSNHFMLDIETLGITQDAFILSIACVRFNLSGQILEEFHHFPNESSQHSRSIELSTVKWWINQEKEAQEKVFNREVERSSLGCILRQLRTFLGSEPIVWGNGNMFDNAILRDLFRMYEMQSPIHYRNDLDMRTLKLLADLKGIDYDIPFEGTAHDALDDCKHQVKQVCKIIKEIV